MSGFVMLCRRPLVRTAVIVMSVAMVSGFESRVCGEEVIGSPPLIVPGQLGAGSGATSGMSFGTEALRLRSPAPHIRFDDASGRDWQLEINDYFGIRDETSGSLVFRIDGDLSADTLRITRETDGSGSVGVNGAPLDSATLHLFELDTPMIRLEQTLIGDPYAWEIGSNADGFGIRDATEGTLPFVVESGAPDNVLYLSANGSLGMGTSQPRQIVNTTAGGRYFNFRNDAGLTRFALQGSSGAELTVVDLGGVVNEKILRMKVDAGAAKFTSLKDDLSGNTVNNILVMELETGRIGISNGAPAHPLHVGNSGVNGNGAHLTAGGVWTNASSRAFKSDIAAVGLHHARKAVHALQPVRFRYTNEPDETYCGFIAEDVPDLVATKDRQGIAAMDVVAVLSRVVQEQDRLLAEQQQINLEQRALTAALSRRLTELERSCCGGSASTAESAPSPVASHGRELFRAPFFGPFADGDSSDRVRWHNTAGRGVESTTANASVDDGHAYRFNLEGDRDRNLPAVAVANGTATSLAAALEIESDDYPGTREADTLLIDHGDYFTGYRGLSRLAVVAGETVYAGQEIGTITATEGGACELQFAVYRLQASEMDSGRRRLVSEFATIRERGFYIGLPKSLEAPVGGVVQVAARVPFFADRYTINDPYYAPSTQWTSSDPRIASVDSHGGVTGHAAGTAAIRLLFSGEEHTVSVVVR